MKNYDGAMVMPANYAVVTNEEMTYLDGGRTQSFSGARGWTVVSQLICAGKLLCGAAGVSTWALKNSTAALLGSGPIGWLVSAIFWFSSALLTGIGSQICSAGYSASYNMSKKGNFTLKTTYNPFSFISIS